MVDEYTTEVTLNGCSDVYCVDAGVYGLSRYGAVYIIDAEYPAVIDTGIGKNYNRILNAMGAIGITREELTYILPTHVHLDHAGGTGYLAQECPEATVGVHEFGASHLVDPSGLIEGTKRAVGRERWEDYGEPVPVSEERIEEFVGGERLDLGDHSLQIHHAPGHAPHQVVFENPENDLVFVADAAGNWFPDRGFARALSPPPDFDLEQCLDDIDMLRSLDPETLCYAHFGPDSADENLDLFEEVLVDWVNAIEQKRQDCDSDEAVVDYFATRNGVTHLWPESQAYGATAMNVRGVLQFLDTRDES